MRDVRYAVRTLIRQPAFALAAILTLAIGIGANTAIFGLLYQIFLRPLPYPEPDAPRLRLEHLSTHGAAQGRRVDSRLPGSHRAERRRSRMPRSSR